MSSQEMFVIKDGVLRKYNGPGGDVVIPEGVTEICESAFSCCTGLTSVTIPGSVTRIGEFAFRGCTGLTSVIIPEGVTEIGVEAFTGCIRLTRVTLPVSVVKVGCRAFYGCSDLTQMTLALDQLPGAQNMFKPTPKTVELLVRNRTDEKTCMVASFRKEYFMQGWDYSKEYLIPLEPEDILVYDQLLASGKHEGFQMNEDGRIKAMLLRLQDAERPVREEFRGIFADFLSGKTSKVLKLAEKEKNAAYVRVLLKVGAIDGTNWKRVKKQLSASESADLRELAEELNEEEIAVSAASEDVERAVERKFLERLRKINARSVLLKYGVQDLPPVHLAGGGELAPPEYLELCLAEYLKQQSKWSAALCPLADEAAAKLDRDELVRALLSLLEQVEPESKQVAFLPVLFRYADGETMGRLYRKYNAIWKLSDFAKHALLFSDTREAMIYAEKNQMLWEYASLRNMDEETLRNTKLLDFGLDADGKKVYDLGGNTVTVTLGPDLTLSLYDGNTKKTVKSLPKRGADPEKYEAAKADLSEMKKNIKKTVKTHCDQLFEKFLSGKKINGDTWTASYLGNPLLRQTAALLVWSQAGHTFTLQERQPVDSEGQPFALTRDPIRLAHPMEMDRGDLARWQKYFTSHALKQPFAQVWEPVMDFTQVKEDRYQGIEIPAYRFKGQEKHGIELKIDQGIYEVSVFLTDCLLWVDGNALFDTLGLSGYSLYQNVTLQKFECRKESRASNHIIGLLDKWTVYGRILKDDVSAVEHLDSFTLAQVTELLNLAIENSCTNCTAALLEYKNTHFPDFDPMDVFTLE